MYVIKKIAIQYIFGYSIIKEIKFFLVIQT